MGNTSSSSSAAARLDGCSKSTIVAVQDTETGSHVLTVRGFSRTKGLGVGKCICSGAFTVGGHSWCIAYYPDGERPGSGDWISVFVFHHQPAAGGTSQDVNARVQLSVLRPNGTRLQEYTKTTQSPVAFGPASGRQSWGWCRFIRRGELKFLGLRGDTLQIRCDVTVVKDTRVETTATSPSPAVAVPPPDLHRHLGHLLESKVGADVAFDVRGEVFMAHRAVLATRSSVFMAELFGDTKEKATSCVHVDDMYPSVFQALLHFIYTDSLPNMRPGDMAVMAQHLLVAADNYDLKRLMLICEDKLCAFVDEKTVATSLALAEVHGFTSLKEACVQFLMSRENLKSLMASSDFVHLTRSCPSLVKELLAKVVS
ncbi:hypothetical protein BS78_05G214700 [Paspalum vaginatum]|nr:hypothetical protein BS78_05G214700 [Paspalum vaginatum]